MAVFSVVFYSGLFGTQRLDSEFYQPKFKENEALLLRYPSITTLGEITTKFYKGIFDIKADEYVDEGIPFIRINNLSNGVISENGIAFITLERHIKESKTALKKYDLVLSKTGSPAASLVQLDECNASQDIIAVSTNQTEDFNVFLAVFLNTKFGLLQMERLFQGNVQMHLSLAEAKTIVVPVPSKKFQREIRKTFEQSIRKQQESKQFYADAEKALLRHLNLYATDIADKKTFIANLSDIHKTKRLDAEHFQPKYSNLLNTLFKTNRAIRLGDYVVKPISRGVLPEYVEGGEVLVINSKHIGKTHIELNDNRYTSREFSFAPNNGRALLQQFDVLLNSTGFITIGRCQTLLDKIEAIVDGHVSVIRPVAELDPVYLGLFLNSLPGQMQTERGWTGSSGQIELRPEIIADFTIWNAPKNVQKEIRKKVEDSHNARRVAEKLFREAKQRVEQMIVAGE